MTAPSFRERYVDAITDMQDDELLDRLQRATVSNSYGSHDDQSLASWRISILRTEILGRISRIPDCDKCNTEGETTPAYADGKTRFGPWVNLCRRHFDAHGIELGLGAGARGKGLVVRDEC
jgi:hypothetical protein